MASDDVCDASTITLLLQNDCDCLWIPSSSATLHEPVVNFENIGEKPTLETPFFQPMVKEENGDEDLDVCFVPPGKKRRLSSIQVQFLEKSFEVENKLEPERKNQLAKDLGLQPRQVAIWFQNRRARYKNKQLEKDYDCLKSGYDKLKSDYDNLHKQNEDLRNEVLSLKKKLLNDEKMTEKLNKLDRIDAHNVNFPTPNSVFDKGVNLPFVTFKQEDANSAKSEILDSDSPHSFLEPDSSHIFEPDQSDFSQDEEDDLCRNFLPQSYFPKLCHDPIANSCNFEFPTMDDQPIWSGLPELSFSI